MISAEKCVCLCVCVFEEGSQSFTEFSNIVRVKYYNMMSWSCQGWDVMKVEELTDMLLRGRHSGCSVSTGTLSATLAQ